jgi:aspartate racemase
MEKSFKTIGILGGIGAEATLDLYRWIIDLTPVTRDQDHIPTLIYSLPQIPDRTEHLLYGGADPLPLMIHTAQTLAKSGADFIIMPCNTAHAFLSDLQQQLTIPIISMIDETALVVAREIGGGKVGLLATTGTVKLQLYEKALRAAGLDVILPTETYQEDYVMEAIYGERGVKAGFTTGAPVDLLVAASHHLLERGAAALIMGCTEIPLALANTTLPIPLVNPTQIVAQAAVDVALGKRPLAKSAAID